MAVDGSRSNIHRPHNPTIGSGEGPNFQARVMAMRMSSKVKQRGLGNTRGFGANPNDSNDHDADDLSSKVK